jgi:hypothetical protein
MRLGSPGPVSPACRPPSDNRFSRVSSLAGKILLLTATLSFAAIGRLHGQAAAPTISSAPAVPRPVPAPSPLPSPPLQPIVPPLARRDVAEIQRLTPRVELWRASGQRPQVPARRQDAVENAYVAGSEPVIIRLQFGAGLAGERVTVVGARGVSLQPPQQVLSVSSTGDCVVSVQLAEGARRGHLLVYCKMIRTAVPLTRASLATVQGEEARTGSRP